MSDEPHIEPAGEGGADDLVGEVARLRGELESATLRAEIAHELAAGGAVDVEATLPLVERQMSSQTRPNVSSAVREVKRRKPLLFGPARRGASVMSGQAGDAAEELSRLAERAASRGDRSSLMRYLRARRSGF